MNEATSDRHRLFTLVLALIPLLLLLFLELGLRLAGYGSDYPLTYSLTIENSDYLRLNRSFPGKYFSNDPGAPEFRDRIFPAEKAENTRRIIALGGSTMFGFPYTYTVNIPQMTEYMLNVHRPDLKWEVICLATSAVNSHSILDISRQLSPLKPDALMIYAGHNEFYGAYGSGSRIQAPGGSALVRISLRLKEFRIYQLMQSLLSALKRTSPAPKGSATLMSRIVEDKHISYDSEKLRSTHDQFRRNLESVAEITRKNALPVTIATLSSNLRDQPPFISLPPELEMKKQALLKDFEALLYQDRASTSAADYAGQDPVHQPSNADPAPPTAVSDPPGPSLTKPFCRAHSIPVPSAFHSYLQGLELLHSGLPDSAYRYFSEARDLDALRFRAASDLNDIIRRHALEYSWDLVDVETLFRSVAEDSIPGNDLFLEHLHPNIRGNFLMSRAFFQSLNDIFPLRDSASSPAVVTGPSEKDFFAAYPVTGFEERAGELSILQLTSAWPFSYSEQRPELRASTPDEKLIIDYLEGRLPYDSALKNWAEIRASVPAPHDRLAALQSLYLANPLNDALLAEIMAYFEQHAQTEEGLKWIQLAEQYRLSYRSRYLSGIFLYRANRVAEAETAFEQALELYRQSSVRNRDFSAELHFNYLTALALQQKYPQALEHLDALSPDLKNDARIRSLRQKLITVISS